MEPASLKPLKDLLFPIQYLEICQSLVNAADGDFEPIMEACGLKVENLMVPMMMIDGEKLLHVYKSTLNFCHEKKPYCLQVLDYFPITAHGLMGVLAMTSPKLEDALNAALEFFPLLMPSFHVERKDIKDEVYLLFNPTCSFGEYDNFFAELIPLAIFQIAPFLSKRPENIQCFFSHVSDFNPNIYKEQLGIDVHFNAKGNYLVFPKSILNTSLITSSAGVYNQSKSSLQAINDSSKNKNPVTARVKEVLTKHLKQNKFMSNDSVARSMNMPERTLARQLASEGYTILKLKNEIRIELAKTLLIQNNKNINEISKKLGYSNADNFSRFFKSVTGETPKQFRDKHKY
ncbi:AraC family transcriptional regulator [Acinetobacter sp. GN11]